ncbi:MAG: cytochrome c biogenesis protein CcdA [Clostridia bacterium]|nr:cytochrome c biogenesis protein CcdA [Clostridia bacterium]
MLYLISFLEGIITFISPCMLPMLPVYVSYFAGNDEEKGTGKTLINALGFVLGFTVIFILMGAFAGAVGGFLRKYQIAVNIITGLIVIFFGLNFMGIFRINIFRGMSGRMDNKELGFFSSLIFGIIFSVGWTPCVGTFLGSALMMASGSGSTVKGIFMLIAYSLGLGIPFIASALLIDKLKGAFSFIKRHYNIINLVSGILLIIVGILMMTGLMGIFLGMLGD